VVAVPVDASPPARARIAVAILCGLAGATIAWVKVWHGGSGFAADFVYFWSGARDLLVGTDPYRGAIQPYVYPLTAPLVVVPVAALSMEWAGILFVGASMACAGYALPWRLLPVLMSFPALFAMNGGQWSPLVMCAALASGWGWAAACKPTLGAAMLARRMDWRGAVVGAVFAIATLAANPRWPLEWLEALRAGAASGLYHVPLLVMGGPLLALAAIKWRTEDGRLLIAMSIIPQSMWGYDQLALGLLARTRLEAIVFSLWSYAVMIAGFLLAPDTLATKAQNAEYLSRVVVWGYYLPALLFLLRRSPRE
jgi:hypothetical protein